MPGPVIKVFTHIHFSQRHDEISTIVIPILQVWKLRYRVHNLPKVIQPINGRASISSLMPKSILFTTPLYCSSVCMALERNSVSGRAGRKASQQLGMEAIVDHDEMTLTDPRLPEFLPMCSPLPHWVCAVPVTCLANSMWWKQLSGTSNPGLKRSGASTLSVLWRSTVCLPVRGHMWREDLEAEKPCGEEQRHLS